MKAVVVREGGPTLEERPAPVPRPNEVLVKVKAASLNRLDLQVAQGVTHGKSGGIGNVMGIEWSGTVVEIGADAPSTLKPGDSVMCSGVGGYAEMAVADWGRVHKFPESLSDFVQAAALPVSLQTSHEALVGSGQFQRGQTVMIRGAGSVIGLMSAQVAKYLGASVVIGTTTTAARIPALKTFGLDVGVATDDSSWVQQVLDATQGRGVDLVIDMVAGHTLNSTMAATRVAGRIVNVGRMDGFTGEFDFDLHAMRRIQYIGTSFRTRTLDEVRAVAQNMRDDLWAAVAAQQLTIPVAGRFAHADFRSALDSMKSNRHLGKIVLEL